MVSCPHCGKTSEVTHQGKSSVVAIQSRGIPVSLGCGTLILIASIVAMFSGNEGREVRSDIQALVRKLDDLQLELKHARREAPEKVNQ